MAQSPTRRRGHNVFKLDPQQAEQFQQEERRDPYDKQPFKTGDEVVVCSNSRCRAALRWVTFKALGYQCVCGNAGTAESFPRPVTLNLGRRRAPTGQPGGTAPPPTQPRDSQGRFRPSNDRQGESTAGPWTAAQRPDHRARFRVRHRDPPPSVTRSPPPPLPPAREQPRERDGLPGWVVVLLVIGLIAISAAID